MLAGSNMGTNALIAMRQTPLRCPAGLWISSLCVCVCVCVCVGIALSQRQQQMTGLHLVV